MMQVLVPTTNSDRSCHLLQLWDIGDDDEQLASWTSLSPSIYIV